MVHIRPEAVDGCRRDKESDEMQGDTGETSWECRPKYINLFAAGRGSVRSILIDVQEPKSLFSAESRASLIYVGTSDNNAPTYRLCMPLPCPWKPGDININSPTRLKRAIDLFLRVTQFLVWKMPCPVCTPHPHEVACILCLTVDRHL